MKLLVLLTALLSSIAMAYPPAPSHEIYGMVKSAFGEPLDDDTTVILRDADANIIAISEVDTQFIVGQNYKLEIPMDANLFGDLYQENVLTPGATFTIEVLIGSTSYVPLEIDGITQTIGAPGESTRLDLTVGEDEDGDGMPDSWENQIIAISADASSLEDVTRDGDIDGDGVSNYIEYLAGTYAFDSRVSFKISVEEKQDGYARLRFLAVRNKTYSILSSEDLETYENEDISSTSDLTESSQYFSVDNTQYVDVYVPASMSQFYRLVVQ